MSDKMSDKMSNKIIQSTFTSLFAALICVGCFISVPLPGGVPITVQNLFAVLAAIVLGGLQGAASVLIFMVLGLIGLPVFSGCHGGPAVFFGPTGGYIWGYFLSAIVAGLIVGKPTIENCRPKGKGMVLYILKIALASILGFVVLYIPGIPWFMHVMNGKGNPVDFSKALSLTVTPFIVGDLIKFAVSVPLAIVLRPVAARYLRINN